MTKPKSAPCSGYEFAVRRQAAGLDNATFKRLSGFSVSALTKWNAGQLPVSRKAYRLLEEVEIGIERESQRIIDEAELRIDRGETDITLEIFNPNWTYGDMPLSVAVARARRLLADAFEDVRFRIKQPPGIVPLQAPPYAFDVPEDE